MRIRACVFAAALLVAAVPASVAASQRSVTDGISSIPSIPAAWAGIWSYTDTTYSTCTGGGSATVSTGFDTLCTDGVYPFDAVEGIVIECNGTADDNSASIICTYSGELYTGCTIQVTITTTSIRTGESYTQTSQTSQTFTPSLCAYLPDSCKITNRHATRIAGQPSTCASPALPTTWGQVKALYR